jgi:hypothetical protein
MPPPHNSCGSAESRFTPVFNLLIAIAGAFPLRPRLNSRRAATEPDNLGKKIVNFPATDFP